MHKSVQHKGKRKLRFPKFRLTARLWAHICAPTLAIVLATSIICFSPTASSGQPAPEIFGNITLSPRFSPDPYIIRGASGGSIPAAIIAQRETTPNGPCVGLVDEEPDHRIVLTAFFNYLSLQVQSAQDTTIVVKGPGGSWCNDDLDGKSPGIAGQWLKGTYEVWVGSYESGKYYPYIIKITAAPLLNPFGR